MWLHFKENMELYAKIEIKIAVILEGENEKNLICCYFIFGYGWYYWLFEERSLQL